jgi:hypothetical protein
MAACAAVLLALGCGGDEFVAGIGNGGNRIYSSPIDEVVDTLGQDPSVPPVTDAMLRAAFDAIVRRAGDGDPEAVMVLYRVAAQQREPKEAD